MKCIATSSKYCIIHKNFPAEKIIILSDSDGFNELISLAKLYDEASFEKKKMIVNCLIKRIEVSRGYKLKVEFNIDFGQFIVGLDKVKQTD